MAADNKEIPLDLRMILNDISKLNDDIRNDHARIDEKIFVRDFLPLLTADVEVDLRPWISIAGHANRSVDVVRRVGNEQVILYTVPPLLNHKGGTATDYNPRLSIFQLVSEAAQRAKNFPGQEGAIFKNAMENAQVGDITTDDSYFIQWNAVLVANGLPPISIPELESQLKGAAVEQENDDGIEGWDDV